MMADAARQKLQDAALLLGLFRKSAWRFASIEAGDLHVLVSRERATRRAVDTPGFVLSAPHIATLKSCARAGEIVAAGQAYATIEVLDQISDLTADVDLRVVEQLAGGGTLLEFETGIVRVCKV